MATNDYAATVREVIDQLWNKGNVDYVEQAFPADFVSYDPVFGQTDRAGVKKIVSSIRAGFTDLSERIDELITAVDNVIVRWSCSGTHRGAFMGMSPTGKQSTVSGIDIYRFENGRLRYNWSNWDALGLMRTIGAVTQLPFQAPVG